MVAPRAQEDKNEDKGIASAGEMNNLFRSKMSDIPYAWQVVRVLGEVEKEFLVDGTITVDEVKRIAHNISQILQDSSRTSDAVHLIQRYLSIRDIEQFLQETKTLADVVSNEAAKIDFATPKKKTEALFKEGMKEIKLPTDRITIERERETETAEGMVIRRIKSEVSINTIVMGAWKQETSRISHDFRIIGSQAPVEMIDLACMDCQQRLRSLCDLANDVLTLRPNYKNLKKGLWSAAAISEDKQKVLENIEKKLAEIMDGIDTLDAAGVYKSLRATLVEQGEKIMREAVVTKYDALMKPVLRSDSQRRLG
jgi:hypothetical protein